MARRAPAWTAAPAIGEPAGAVGKIMDVMPNSSHMYPWGEKELSFVTNAEGYIVSKVSISTEADARSRRNTSKEQAATEVDPAISPPAF